MRKMVAEWRSPRCQIYHYASPYVPFLRRLNQHSASQYDRFGKTYRIFDFERYLDFLLVSSV